MKSLLYLLGLAGLSFFFASSYAASNPDLQNGDIIFQTSRSAQSEAIQLATHSRYSHMGIVYEVNGHFFVYEAIQPVQLTPLDKWIARGQEEHYIVKRLRDADKLLTPAALDKMKKIGERYVDLDYDLYFEWSDNKMYCSELVWKIYKEALGIEIGQLEKLSDFDLSHKVVQDKMQERYGDEIPKNELFISPRAMFESELLEKVR